MLLLLQYVPDLFHTAVRCFLPQINFQIIMWISTYISQIDQILTYICCNFCPAAVIANRIYCHKFLWGFTTLFFFRLDYSVSFFGQFFQTLLLKCSKVTAQAQICIPNRKAQNYIHTQSTFILSLSYLSSRCSIVFTS